MSLGVMLATLDPPLFPHASGQKAARATARSAVVAFMGATLVRRNPEGNVRDAEGAWKTKTSVLRLLGVADLALELRQVHRADTPALQGRGRRRLDARLAVDELHDDLVVVDHGGERG